MSLWRSSALVGFWTFLSRLLGFIRDLLLAMSFGSGPVADAFVAAFQIPNLCRRLFAEGAFNAAFVPVFTQQLQNFGKNSAKLFAENILVYLLGILLAVNIFAIMFMPEIVLVLAPGYSTQTISWVSDAFSLDLPFVHSPDEEKFALTVTYARILFPYLIFASVMALYAGILNSFDKFSLAAAAPCLLNVIAIAALALGLGVGEERLSQIITSCFALLSLSFEPLPPRQLSAVIFIYAIVLSGVCQAGLLLWGLSRLRFSLRLVRPRWSPLVGQFFTLFGPGLLAGGVVQINIMAGGIIASFQEGGRAYLYYADRLYQFPLGLIGIAIGVVLLPKLTTSLQKKPEDARDLVDHSLLLAMVFTLPATFGLWSLALAIITVLFEYGQFGAEDSRNTALALQAFVFGLPAYVGVKVFSPGFFARLDTKTPMRLAALSMVINILMSLVLFPFYGHVGIAASTSIAAWCQLVCMLVIMNLRGYHHWQLSTIVKIGQILLASAFMSIILYLIPPLQMFGLHAVDLGIRILVGLISFILISWLFGVHHIATKNLSSRRHEI